VICCIKLQVGHPVVIEPLPPEAERVEVQPVPEAKRSVWEAHFGLFLTIIILLAVCIIVTIICCICLKCRARDDSEKASLISQWLGASANCFQIASYFHSPFFHLYQAKTFSSV